jgi:hypothetical protein
VSAGAIAAVLGCAAITIVFIPSFIGTCVQFRTGLIPSLGSKTFRAYRFSGKARFSTNIACGYIAHNCTALANRGHHGASFRRELLGGSIDGFCLLGAGWWSRLYRGVACKLSTMFIQYRFFVPDTF